MQCNHILDLQPGSVIQFYHEGLKETRFILSKLYLTLNEKLTIKNDSKLMKLTTAMI